MATLDRVDLDGELVLLKLHGVLDHQGLAKVEGPFGTITRSPGARIVVDLSGVDMVTTPALSMFLDAAKNSRESGGRLIFTETQPPVRDILQRLRLHAILRTVPGLDQAIHVARH